MTTPETISHLNQYGDVYNTTYGVPVLERPEFWIFGDGSPPIASPVDDLGETPLFNEQQPGSSGGVIEIVKRALVTALRTAITGTSLSLPNNNQVHVDLEYPNTPETYPAIWVQFSLRKMQISGLGHQWTTETGEIVQQWSYDGEVTLTIVAMTSIERDRIGDMLISYFAFSRVAAADTNQPSLYRSLADNPYVAMVINSDQMTPGGQSTNLGVPWNPDQLAYEDNFKFELYGEFQSVHDPKLGGSTLRAIKVVPTVEYRSITPGTWI